MNPQPIRRLEDFEELARRGRESLYPSRPKLTVGTSSCGLAAGAGEQFELLEGMLAEHGADMVLARTGCIGFCQREPLVDVAFPGRSRVVFAGLDADELAELFHLAARGEYFRFDHLPGGWLMLPHSALEQGPERALSAEFNVDGRTYRVLRRN